MPSAKFKTAFQAFYLIALPALLLVAILKADGWTSASVGAFAYRFASGLLLTPLQRSFGSRWTRRFFLSRDRKQLLSDG